MRIAIAESIEEILRCAPVMRELRPQLSEEEFVERVRRQEAEGYRLAFVEADGVVRSVAGYRILEALVAGRFLYVDDLVTREADRSRGHGERLFDWLVERASAAGCATLQLDSAVHRFDAHRFYLRKRMKIAAHHFVLELER